MGVLAERLECEIGEVSFRGSRDLLRLSCSELMGRL